MLLFSRGLLVLALCCAAAAQAAEPTPPDAETSAQRDARMAWWREAKFGMFVHWGLYAVTAGRWNDRPIAGAGEWIMHDAKIPVADYAALAPKFNPTGFDADQWVSLAKAAGMKYIVITSKHHDGFAMFHSAASPYNVFDATPFKRDPLQELAEACRKQGMRLGFYYSQAQDWHHPGGAAMGGHWDPAQDGSMDDCLRAVAVPQVKEILTRYGPVSVLWLDTPEGITRERANLFRLLLGLQPGLIVNNRLGGGFHGDTETPEQSIPANGSPGKDWETCMTMNDTWGFKRDDQHWKSAQTLIRNLCDIASKGGNYLLNVGPTAEGEIPAPSVERLRAVGDWLKVNGGAIYGASASPFEEQFPWGRATRKTGKLYLSVFDWPKDGKLFVPLLNQLKGISLLADPSWRFGWTEDSSKGIEISLPPHAPDPNASVIELRFEGEAVAAVPGEKAVGGNWTLTMTTDGGAKGTIILGHPRWNGKLLIVAHGFVPEGRPLLAALDREDPVYRRLLSQGWMIAATSYRRNGLVLADAVADVEAMRREVAGSFPPPETVVVEGTSMGGFVGAMIAEHPPDPSYKGVLALGAALEIKEPGEHPATLSARPKLPLLLLSTQDEITGPAAYAQRADAGGGNVPPAVWKVARNGHVNLNRREVGAAYDALLGWIDGGKPPEPRRDVTQAPTPRASTVTFAAGDVSAAGKVTAADPAYGNLTVDFQPGDMARLGLQKGDTVLIRIGGEGAPEQRVLCGTTFGDVPKGEWVCFPTADNDLLICRNFADAAASAKANVGTPVTVRKADGK